MYSANFNSIEGVVRAVEVHQLVNDIGVDLRGRRSVHQFLEQVIFLVACYASSQDNRKRRSITISSSGIFCSEQNIPAFWRFGPKRVGVPRFGAATPDLFGLD